MELKLLIPPNNKKDNAVKIEMRPINWEVMLFSYSLIFNSIRPLDSSIVDCLAFLMLNSISSFVALYAILYTVPIILSKLPSSCPILLSFASSKIY